MIQITILIAIAAILQSEACIPIGGGGGGSGATTTMKSTTAGETTAKGTTTTAKPTTAKAPDCPMENMNCLLPDASNLLEIKEEASVKDCSKYIDLNIIPESDNYEYE